MLGEGSNRMAKPVQWAQVGPVFDAKAAGWDGKGTHVVVSMDDCPLDAFARTQARPGLCVVDLGGGNGKALRKLAPLCPGGSLTLVDLSRGMVNAAAQILGTFGGVSRVVANATRTPLPRSSADLVLMRQILQHVPCPRAVVREAARLLRPGGCAVIQVPGPSYLSSWQPFTDHEEDAIGRFSVDDITGMLEREGLQADVSSYRFDFYFRNTVEAWGFFLENSLLDKLTGYQPATTAVVQGLLQQPVITGLLTVKGTGEVSVGAEYVLGVGLR